MAVVDPAMEADGTASPAARHARVSDRYLYWIIFTGCLGLLVVRGWDRLTHPDLFAEGVRFVGSAFNDGWWSLLQPYDHYFHTAPKLIALLGMSLVPVAHLPLFTNLACVAVAAACMASIARPGYRWLVPADGARAVLALLMVLAPGQIEILGNLAGVHWYLLLYLAVLSLKDPKHPYTVWELALAAGIAMTSAGAIVFLPVAFLRLVFARRRRSTVAVRPALGLKRIQGESIFFAILFLVTVYLFLGFLTRDSSVGGAGLDIVGAARGIEELLPQLAALFSTFYFLHPFLGTQNTTAFLVSTPLYPLFAAALLIVLALLARLQRQLDYRFWLVPAWLGSMIMFAVMLSIVRYWSFYGIFSYPYPDWWFRYNFVFAGTGLVFWFALLRVRRFAAFNRWPNLVLLALITGYASQAQTPTTSAKPPHENDSFAIQRYSDTSYWTKSAAVLEDAITTGCPGEVRVAGEPGGKWTFVYTSPRARSDCPDS